MAQFNVKLPCGEVHNIEVKSGSERGVSIVLKKKFFDRFDIKVFCSVCNSSKMWEAKDYYPVFTLEGSDVNLAGFRHRLDEGDYSIKICKECFVTEAKGVNPNSSKMLMLKFGVSEDESLKRIHDRSKSPFYKENHSDEETYKTFQNRYKSLESGEKEKLIAKQNAGRHKNYSDYKEKFGEGSFRKSRDSSSLSFFIDKYGHEDGLEMFNEKNKKTSRIRPQGECVLSKKDWLSYVYGIGTLEDFKRFVNKKLSGMDEYDKSFYIRRHTRYDGEYDKMNTLLLFGASVFNIDNIYHFFGVSDEMCFKMQKISDVCFSYTTVVDGFYFRSFTEYKIYDLLKSRVKVVNVNKAYPNQDKSKLGKKFYDICFEYNDKVIYLEIIGFDDDKYIKNVTSKREKWGSIFVHSSKALLLMDDIDNKRELKYEYV